jgi:hypothetical protein
MMGRMQSALDWWPSSSEPVSVIELGCFIEQN